MRDPRTFDEYLQSDSKLVRQVQSRYFPIKEIAGSGTEPEYIRFPFGYNVLKPLVGTLTLSEKESFLGCEKQTAFSLCSQP